jgi:Domain of unknown function (DUF4266)
LKRAYRVIGVVLLLAGVSGCGRYAVRPDEKEYLADRIMQSDFDTQEAASDEHVLDNREGSAGGNGAGGGGCGCN